VRRQGLSGEIGPASGSEREEEPIVGKGQQLTGEESIQRLEERGISIKTAYDFGLRVNLENQAWAYPVIIRGEKVATRFKSFDSNARTKYWSWPRGVGVLVYNLDGIQGEQDIWLCEGEPDVWILHQHGIPAVSFTGGATHVPENAAEQLLQSGVKRINVCYDRDPSGREGAQRVAAALGSQFEVVIRGLPEDLGEKADLTDLYQQEKEDFKEALVSLPVVEVEAVKTIFTWGELRSGDLMPVDWVVDRLIPARGAVVVGGDAGAGKSWFAMHIAQCIAAGAPVLGQFATIQGPVAYVDEESSEPLLKRRIQKLAAGLRVPDDIPVTFFVNHNVRVDEDDSLAELLARLEEVKPRLIIFDSLVRIHSKNENDATEMAKVMAKMREIETRLGCAVMFTHHTRKQSMNNRAGQMLRGSSDIRAFVATHLFMRGTREPARKRIEHDKSRVSQPLDPFEIEIVDDEAGTATFLRYLGPAEAGPGDAPRRRREIARDLILEMLDEEGPMARPDIIDRCRGQAGERAVGDALIELYADRTLIREVGERGQHIYRLAQTPQAAEEDSGLSFGP